MKILQSVNEWALISSYGNNAIAAQWLDGSRAELMRPFNRWQHVSDKTSAAQHWQYFRLCELEYTEYCVGLYSKYQNIAYEWSHGWSLVTLVTTYALVWLFPIWFLTDQCLVYKFHITSMWYSTIIVFFSFVEMLVGFTVFWHIVHSLFVFSLNSFLS